MSTNATISVKVGDTIKSIYLHYDGYPSHAFGILSAHYNTQEKAEALVNLGDLSVLAESCECPEGHSYDTPVEGYTIAYHRDRGEDWESTCTEIEYSDEPKYTDAPYHYYFNGGKWEIT